MLRSLSVVVCASLLLACDGGGAPERAAPEVATPAPPPTATPPVITPEPAPSVEPAPPVASEPPTAPASDAAPVEALNPVASDFHLAAYRDGSLGLYPMRDGVLLVGGAQAFAEAQGPAQLSRRPDMTRGFLDPGELFLTDWHTGAVGGRWPDSAWLSAYFLGQRWESPFYMYYRKGDRWQRKANVKPPLQWFYVGFAGWTAGQTLALRLQSIDPNVLMKYGSEELPPAVAKRHAELLAGAGPRFDVIDPAPGAAAPPSFPARVSAHAFTTHADGKIDAIVRDEQGALTLLRWPVGAEEPRRFALPRISDEFPGDRELQMVAHRDGGLWIGAPLSEGSYLARFDGDAWSPRTLPTKQPLRSLAAGEDGVLWAVTGIEYPLYEGGADEQGHLWRSADGERWHAVPLPTVQFPDLAEKRWEYFSADSNYVELYGDAEAAKQRHRVSPRQVWSGGGEVWVAGVTGAAPRLGAEMSTRAVALRTGAVERPLGLPSDNDLRLELLDERPVKDHVFKEETFCEGLRLTTFVTLPASTPTSGPIASVDVLLTEHPELALDLSEIWLARHRGDLVLAFIADGIDKDRAKALLALLAEMAPEKRSFACRLPMMVRPLYSDAAMRELAKAYRAKHPQP